MILLLIWKDKFSKKLNIFLGNNLSSMKLRALFSSLTLIKIQNQSPDFGCTKIVAKSRGFPDVWIFELKYFTREIEIYRLHIKTTPKSGSWFFSLKRYECCKVFLDREISSTTVLTRCLKDNQSLKIPRIKAAIGEWPP